MKSKLLWIFILVICANIQLVSQAPAWHWAKTANSAGPEHAWDVSYDTFSGNIYVGGSFDGNLSAAYGPQLSSTFGQSDGFLAKYDSDGNVLWAFKIGGSDMEEIKSVAADGLGNVYVAGYFRSNCDFDPGPLSYNLIPAGGIGSQDGFLAKYTSLGALVWATKFGNTLAEDVWRLFVDANGIYLTGSYSGNVTFNSASPSVVTKTTTANQGGTEFFGAKYNALGVVQWVATGASQKDDNGYDVVADNTSVYIIGTYQKDMNLYNASGTFTQQLLVANNNNSSIFITAYDQSTGALKWATNIGSFNNDDTGNGITQDNTDLYITGAIKGTANFPISSPLFTKSSSGNIDMFVAKLSKSSGTFQWVSAQTCTGNGNEAGYEIEKDAFGNLIVAGYFDSPINFPSGPAFSTSGNEDVLISAYSAAGSFLWATKAGANNADIPYGLAANTTGGIYVAGEHDNATVFGSYTLASGGSSNIFVAKTGCEAAGNNTVAASQTLCAGSVPLPFSGSVPDGGNFSYIWEQSANSLTWTVASLTHTNQGYSPPTLSVTTYYRRNAIAGSACSNPSNSNTVSILVNQAPTTANAGGSQTLCISAPVATLSGNVPAVGTGSWSVVSGSAAISTPTLATTPVTGLGLGPTVLKWSIGNGVCAASTATVSIMVDNLPTTPVAGTSQTLCILTPSALLGGNPPTVGIGSWSVIGGTGLIALPTLPATTVTGLAIGTTTLGWTTRNGVCAALTSTKTIQVDALPTPASAGTAQTLCINSPSAQLNGNVPTVGTGIWSVFFGSLVITSPNTASSTITGAVTGSNVLKWSIGNGVCPVNTSTMLIKVDALPGSALAGSNQEICNPATAFTGTAPAVGNGLWTLTAGNATIATPASAVSALSVATGTNTFLWSVSNGVCPASTASVIIVRDAVPTPASAGTAQTLCINSPSTQLNGNVPTVGTGTWSVFFGNLVIVSPNTASSTITGAATGSNVLKWSVGNGVCPISTSTMLIKVDALPGSALAGSDQEICNPATAFTGTAPAIGNGLWTLTAGNATIATPASAVSALSVATGTNTFLWSVSNGVCPASTATVNIVRDALPTPASAGTAQTLCINSPSAQLNGNVPTVGTGTWSVFFGSLVITSPNTASSTITGAVTGSNVLKWSIGNGVCPVNTSTMLIKVDALPGSALAGSYQEICNPVTAFTGTAPAVGNGLWTLTAGNATIATPASAVSALSVATGTNTFLWSVSNGVCPASTATVNIVRDALPTPANAGTVQTLCANSPSAQLSGNLPAVGSGTWLVVSGSMVIASANTATSAITGAATGSNVLLWSIGNGVCPVSTSSAVVQVDALPSNALAGSDQEICNLVTAFTGTAPAVGNGLWTLTAGNATIATPASAVSALSVATGTNTFLWSVSNGVCPASTASVIIVRDALPTPASAGTVQTLCANSPSAQLSGNLPAVGSGTWLVVSGSMVIASANTATSAITGAATGSNVLLWSIGNGVCPVSTSSAVVQVDALPSNALAGSDQEICNLVTAFTGTAPAVGNGLWTLTAGNATIATPASAVSALSVATGTNTFLWSVSNGVCPASTASVIIVRDALPTPASAGTVQTLCANSPSAQLSGNLPAVGSGTWSVVSGNMVIVSANTASSAITGAATGSNVLSWSIDNGVCPLSTATVLVQVDAIPTTPIAGQSQTLCISSPSLQLAANAPATGTGSWLVTSGTGSISAITNPAATFSSISVGITVLEWAISNGACSALTATTQIQVDDLPSAAVAGPGQTVCASSASTTLSGNVPTVGSGAWSVLSGSGTVPVTSAASGTVFNLGSGINILQWQISNGVCAASSSTASIQVDAVPDIPFAGSDYALCTSTGTLSAAVPQQGSGTWSSAQANAAVTNSNTASTTVSGLTVGANTFVWTLVNGICPSVSDTVIISRDALPDVAYAGRDTLLCSSSAGLAANTPSTGSGNWSLYSGSGNISSPGNFTTMVSGLTDGPNVFIWKITSGTCPSSVDTAIITVDANPANAVAGNDQQLCSSSATLSASQPALGAGWWSLVSGTAVVSDSTLNTSSVSLPDTGLVTLRWTVKNGVCPNVADEVTLRRDADPGLPEAGPDIQVETPAARLSAASPTAGSGFWQVMQGAAIIKNVLDPTSNVDELSTGNNIFRWTIHNGTCASRTDDIIIYLEPLKIPSGFSPNGDGINDAYVIPGIDYYEHADFTVFNRWGAEVFHTGAYKNEWDGTNHSRELLADDTYYYTLKISEKMNYSGYIVLKTTK